MKTSTKRIALLLTLCLLLSALSGCTVTGGNSGGNTGNTGNTGDSDIISIDLFAVNDLHGKFSKNESQPGVGGLTTYLKEAKAENDNTVIFSSGDMWQGSAEAGLTFGNLMTDWMNEVGFSFMTIGNHEFDWGAEYISQNLSVAEFPFLAINIYETENGKGTGKLADFCQPSVMVDLGEVQIGFIGAIGDCYSSVSSEYSAGYTFRVGQALSDLVKAEATALRQQGADIIVYSIHDSSDGVARELTLGEYVDIVFEGHSHSAYAEKDTAGVYHLQGGGENSGISHATLSYDLDKKEVVNVKAEIVNKSVYGQKSDDKVVQTLKDKYDSVIGSIYDTVGYNDTYRGADELKTVVSQTYAALAEHWSDYDIVLGGGFTSCRSPYQLPVGNVNYAMLYMLFPFNNKLALCSCTGADLLKNYINTTNSNYYVAYTAYGESVYDDIDPNQTYYIITDSYNYTYKANRLTVVKEYDSTTFARDLLAAYIKAGNFGQGAADESLTDGEEYTVPELLDFAASLPAGAESSGTFYVTGTVMRIENTTYGNCYIEDADGNELYVYGLYKNSIKYGEMTDPPKVGDTVRLYGKMKHYVSGTSGSVYELIRAEIQ